MSLLVLPTVSLLLSSRSEVLGREYLERRCDAFISVNDYGVSHDIERLLDQAFAPRGALSGIGDAETVRQTLSAGADGNFRWLVLQIKEISRISGIPSKVRQRLKSLPKTLSEHYARCLESIDEDDRTDVHRLLIWLIFTRDSLSKRKFSQLLAFRHTKDALVYDASLVPTSMDDVMLLIGSTFVSPDSDDDSEVCIAHASVKDYLLALPPSSSFYIDSHLAHLTIVKMCLAYIVSDMAAKLPLPYLQYERTEWQQIIPFLVWKWMYHAPMVDLSRYPALEQDIIYAVDQSTIMSDKGDIASFFLSIAAGLGQTWLMRLLIDKLGADIDSLHPTYIPPIHRAIQEGHYEATRLLIEKGADIASTDKESRTPLHIAAGLNSLPMPIAGILAIMIVEREVGTDTDTQAAKYHGSQLRILQDLLETGIDINVCTDDGLTPLHCAAKAKNPDVIRELLNRGADLHARTTESGCTPLHLAARHQWPPATQLLLNAGANPNSGNDDDQTPLYEAMGGVILLNAGAEVDARQDNGATPLALSAGSHNLEIVQLLISRGANVNASTQDGSTPLHMALDVSRRSEIVQVLLDAGADMETRTTASETPLCIAARNSCVHAMRLLLDRGADIEACGAHGWTLLHIAAHFGNAIAVQLLLWHGADVNARLYEGETPLDVTGTDPQALVNPDDCEDIRQMLLAAGAVGPAAARVECRGESDRLARRRSCRW
ncbi:ankyrin repeat-containing domain protein [Schizophyllum commune]